MKDFFPESLGQKRGCTLYTAKYGNYYTQALHSQYVQKWNYLSLDKIKLHTLTESVIAKPKGTVISAINGRV